MFQSAFSSEANTEIPEKSPSTHPIMKNISISKKGILKLINNINPKNAVGPDNIAGRILKENADISGTEINSRPWPLDFGLGY